MRGPRFRGGCHGSSAPVSCGRVPLAPRRSIATRTDYSYELGRSTDAFPRRNPPRPPLDLPGHPQRCGLRPEQACGSGAPNGRPADEFIRVLNASIRPPTAGRPRRWPPGERSGRPRGAARRPPPSLTRDAGADFRPRRLLPVPPRTPTAVKVSTRRSPSSAPPSTTPRTTTARWPCGSCSSGEPDSPPVRTEHRQSRCVRRQGLRGRTTARQDLLARLGFDTAVAAKRSWPCTSLRRFPPVLDDHRFVQEPARPSSRRGVVSSGCRSRSIVRPRCRTDPRGWSRRHHRWPRCAGRSLRCRSRVRCSRRSTTARR